MPTSSVRTKQQIEERCNGVRDAKVAFARKHDVKSTNDFRRAVLAQPSVRGLSLNAAVRALFGGSDQLSYIIADLLGNGVGQRVKHEGDKSRGIEIDKRAKDTLQGVVRGRDDLNRYNAACSPESIIRDAKPAHIVEPIQKALPKGLTMLSTANVKNIIKLPKAKANKRATSRKSKV